jgi:hypothetical protein
MAQVVDVDPARATNFSKPIPVRPGELIRSDISNDDFNVYFDWNAEHFLFTGRAGEIITARVKTDIRDMEVVIKEKGKSGTVLARGTGKDAPLRAVLPKDGSYFMIVGAKGKDRIGRYELALASGAVAASFPEESKAVATDATLPPTVPPAAVTIAGASPSLEAAPVPPPPPAGSTPRLSPGAAINRPKITEPDMFHLIGFATTSFRVRVDGEGPTEVAIYGPDGELMHSELGSRLVVNEGEFPVDGIYHLTVIRPKSTKPYSIRYTSSEPKN